ncbi:MAG TPA: HAD family acid phosphatase [Kofleriaceae bacterium]|jgi:hypothetical protein
MRSIALAALAVTACTTAGSSAPVGVDPGEQSPAGSASGSGTLDGSGSGSALLDIPDVQCAGVPDAGPAGSFNHISSELISALGDPVHRGFDLVAPASAATQAIEGWISYTAADKALEDEDVDLFACRDGQWQAIGSATTDDEGHFELDLTGGDRLPIALRDMYVSVVGDRTGASFLAFVAPDDAPLIASDVDGTLTSSEDAFAETIVAGIEPDAQPGAATAYTDAASRGYQLVYVTSRGGQYTADTRQWLSDQGFPRGPVRLSTSFITLPGSDTVDYKTQTIDALAQSLSVVMGVGNRETDIEAYTNVGLAPTTIFVKLPEYQGEMQASLDAGAAIGFAAYSDLQSTYIDAMPAR